MIPLSIPQIAGNEWKYIKDCLDTNWISSAGKYVDIFEQKIADYTGAKYAIACVNGTSALHISLKLAGVTAGDEVIAPTLTFIAPINAIAYNGATPIFMDADEFYNIDTKKTIQFIREKTEFRDGFTFNKLTGRRISAIVPVHIWGNAVWLDDLVGICADRNIAIVEDASESLGSRYTDGRFAGKHTGTIGKFGCISFNGNKIITTGGGGMILTDDEEQAARALYLTTQAKDHAEKYIHNEIGYNFRLTNIQAALGVAQLQQLAGFIQKKQEIFKVYTKGLENNSDLRIADVPNYSENNHWLTILQLNGGDYTEKRKQLFEKLSSRGIQTRPVWQLNHLQLPYQGCQSFEVEKALSLLDRSLCMPSSAGMSLNDLDTIISELNE
jgi:perosamine synthetase